VERTSYRNSRRGGGYADERHPSRGPPDALRHSIPVVSDHHSNGTPKTTNTRRGTSSNDARNRNTTWHLANNHQATIETCSCDKDSFFFVIYHGFWWFFFENSFAYFFAGEVLGCVRRSPQPRRLLRLFLVLPVPVLLLLATSPLIPASDRIKTMQSRHTVIRWNSAPTRSAPFF